MHEICDKLRVRMTVIATWNTTWSTADMMFYRNQETQVFVGFQASSLNKSLCPDENADLRSCQFKKMWNFKTATLWSELWCTKSFFLLKTAEIITVSNSIYFVTCYEEQIYFSFRFSKYNFVNPLNKIQLQIDKIDNCNTIKAPSFLEIKS